MTTECAGTWSTTGMRVDDTESTENLGGDHPIHAYPAFVYDTGPDGLTTTTDDRLHVVYARKNSTMGCTRVSLDTR